MLQPIKINTALLTRYMEAVGDSNCPSSGSDKSHNGSEATASYNPAGPPKNAGEGVGRWAVLPAAAARVPLIRQCTGCLRVACLKMGMAFYTCQALQTVCRTLSVPYVLSMGWLVHALSTGDSMKYHCAACLWPSIL